MIGWIVWLFWGLRFPNRLQGYWFRMRCILGWFYQIFSFYSDWDWDFSEIFRFVLDWNWNFCCICRIILLWSVIKLIRSIFLWVNKCLICLMGRVMFTCWFIKWRCSIRFNSRNWWSRCWLRRSWWRMIIRYCMILCGGYISFYCSKICRNLLTFLNNNRCSRFNFCLNNSFITYQGYIHGFLLRIISIHFNFHITITT